MGSFKSSPASSLSVEAGIPPLSYSRDAISLNYFFKVSSLQTLPTHQALVGSLQTEPPAKRLHINNLVRCQINTPELLTISWPETSPMDTGTQRGM